MAPTVNASNQRIEMIKRIHYQNWKQKKTAQKDKSVGTNFGKIMGATDIDNPDARVLLSNMCLSVTAGFLRMLFSDFNVKTLTINHDKDGNPVGTGNVVLPKKNAIQLIRQFTDVVIGSSDIQFKMIATSNIEKRVRFADKQEENAQINTSRVPSKLHEKTRGFMKKMNSNNLNPNVLASTFTNLSI